VGCCIRAEEKKKGIPVPRGRIVGLLGASEEAPSACGGGGLVSERSDELLLLVLVAADDREDKLEEPNSAEALVGKLLDAVEDG
jgi:hypothetical protein